MNKECIKSQIEDYLNGINENIALDAFFQGTSENIFRKAAIKRLSVAFGLFKSNALYKKDYYLALRDFMIYFDADLVLNDLDADFAAEFGMKKDLVKGTWFATYQFPDYINSFFARNAYFKDYKKSRKSRKKYNLFTDSMIYSLTGYSCFKSLSQKMAVYGALNTPDGYTTLVSLPTGGGKSLITQTMAYQFKGLTIVVVPTVSLALDQVRVAKSIIHSENIDEEVFSYNSGIDAAPILKAIREQKAKLLFISPEALINNSGFLEAIAEANKVRYLKNIIIDEAHIVVDWGASFRVDYQCLESWRYQLMRTNPGIRTVLLSATFERTCIDLLHDFFGDDGKWIEIRCDSLRHEPRYMVVKSDTFAEKNKKLIEMVKKLPHPMIIYVARPVDADSVIQQLQEAGINNVRSFTGVTTSDKRRELIDEWVDDQFEIMVATSAFGVGVNKSDVRTVIHMYIPQNPNTYYQELGRGGRDRLPCLSVLCLYREDANIAFQRISKRVLTPEKIIGRWNSIYSNIKSKRIGNLIYIDTTIKPSYNVTDEFDDSPPSDADVNWNVYVLLFLRRYNLIKVREVLSQGGAYIFVIEIVDDRLRTDDDALNNLIENLRQKEWDYYNDSFISIKDAIRRSNSICLSEMFFETYDKVSEFCAGCPAHPEMNDGDFQEFPLKKAVSMPQNVISEQQAAWFGDASNIFIYDVMECKENLINVLVKEGLSIAVNTTVDDANIFLKTEQKKNVFLTDFDLLNELSKRKNKYFISGIIAVFYHGDEDQIYDQYKKVSNIKKKNSELKVIHLLNKIPFFSSIDKALPDLMSGSVISAEAFCKML